MAAPSAITRYHPAIVGIHWLVAALILVMLAVGYLVLDELPNSDPGKLDILLVHMAVGVTILALMVVRLFIRLRTPHPPEASIGIPAADRAALWVHYGFYAVVIAMVLSGLATALVTGLAGSVVERNGQPLPTTFEDFAAFAVHEKLATVLLILIALHVGAALYHQFVRKDRLFRRIWFGSRTE
jgi:cytochrome b561